MFSDSGTVEVVGTISTSYVFGLPSIAQQGQSVQRREQNNQHSIGLGRSRVQDASGKAIGATGADQSSSPDIFDLLHDCNINTYQYGEIIVTKEDPELRLALPFLPPWL